MIFKYIYLYIYLYIYTLHQRKWLSFCEKKKIILCRVESKDQLQYFSKSESALLIKISLLAVNNTHMVCVAFEMWKHYIFWKKPEKTGNCRALNGILCLNACKHVEYNSENTCLIIKLNTFSLSSTCIQSCCFQMHYN